jgi:hypothetical protein
VLQASEARHRGDPGALDSLLLPAGAALLPTCVCPEYAPVQQLFAARSAAPPRLADLAEAALAVIAQLGDALGRIRLSISAWCVCVCVA